MADGEVLYEVRADTSKLDGDLDSAQSKAKESASKLGNIAKTGGKAVAAGFTAVGGAAVAAGGYAANLATDMDKAMNSFAASTSASKSEMEGYQDVLEKIYANNYGDDFQDIADSMALVTKNLGDMSDDQLQSVTESAYALRDTFEYDIAESTRAAKAMMDNFGVSGDEAMSLIAAGAQNGLDYSGELIDSISEYSVQFAKVGFDADDMFKVFQKGAESGAFNLDKVGDAVKEFSIRAIDGSDSTAEGFSKIGLSASDMAAKFGEGGESAKAAFKETLNALASIEDPLEQNTAGVDLFGTMWEDLGPEAVEALADIEDGAYDTGDALNEIKEVKYDDLGSMLEGLKRSVEMLVLPLGEELIPVLTELIEDVLPVIKEVLPDVIDGFSDFLEPILQLAQEALPGIIDGFMQLMSDDILPLMTDTILPALQDAFTALEPIFTMFINDILPVLRDLFNELIPPLMDLLVSLIPPLKDVFEALAVPVLNFVKDLLPSLRDLFNAVGDAVDLLTPVISFLADVLQDRLQTALNVVKTVAETLITVFQNIIEFVKNVFAGNWSEAWGNIVAIFKTQLNYLPSIAETILNGLISAINTATNGINKVIKKIPGSPFGEIPDIPSVSLPRFHTGGIIDFDGNYESPIMALDGEMVLTKSQQKRLFEIANGGYTLPVPSGGSQDSHNKTEVKIEHKNYFTVRNDQDIDRISESLSRKETKDIMSLGGK